MDSPRRKPLRLPGFDHAHPGAYFITVNVADGICLLGSVANGEMRLNELGRIVDWAWRNLPPHFPSIRLDAYVVMPNHLHAVLVIASAGGAALPAIVGTFKSHSTRAANLQRRVDNVPLWQDGYHDRIVRDDADLARIRADIMKDPARWEQDEYHPARHRR